MGVFRPEEDDLIIIRLANEITVTKEVRKQLDEWAQSKGLSHFPAVYDVGMDSDFRIFNEEALNAMGWYQHPGCVVCGVHPAPNPVIRETEQGAVEIVYNCEKHIGGS